MNESHSLSADTEFGQLDALWSEKDGIIRLSSPLISDGATGPEWIDRLASNGFRVSDRNKNLLSSPMFQSTNGISYDLVIINGDIFGHDKRNFGNVYEVAKHLDLATPNLELACLGREFLSDQDLKNMGLWAIVIMHYPTNIDFANVSFASLAYDSSGSWLASGNIGCYNSFYNGVGFGYVANKTASWNT